jgi:hypothetical protein
MLMCFPANLFLYNTFCLISLISLGLDRVCLDIPIRTFIGYKCVSFWLIEVVLIWFTNWSHLIKVIRQDPCPSFPQFLHVWL